MIARRIIVRGRVQGVGFRYATVEAAEHYGITGWVRNRRDGTVEAFIQGEPTAIDAVTAWCRRGPPAARVEEVETTSVAPDPAIVGFSSAPSA